MQKFLLIILLLTALSRSDASAIRDRVFAKLPQELVSLSRASSAAEIKKKFSKKISASDDENIYLRYFGEQNDVTIGLKHQSYQHILIKLPPHLKDKVIDFNEVYQGLSREEQQQNLSTKHEAGRFIMIDLPAEGLKLKFTNNEKKTLNSVLISPPVRKKP